MTKSCSLDVDLCPVDSKDDIHCDFGARLDVCIEAAVRDPCREDLREVIPLPAQNTPVLTAHLTVQLVSLIGEGIVW